MTIRTCISTHAGASAVPTRGSLQGISLKLCFVLVTSQHRAGRAPAVLWPLQCPGHVAPEFLLSTAILESAKGRLGLCRHCSADDMKGSQEPQRKSQALADSAVHCESSPCCLPLQQGFKDTLELLLPHYRITFGVWQSHSMPLISALGDKHTDAVPFQYQRDK